MYPSAWLGCAAEGDAALIRQIEADSSERPTLENPILNFINEIKGGSLLKLFTITSIPILGGDQSPGNSFIKAPTCCQHVTKVELQRLPSFRFTSHRADSAIRTSPVINFRHSPSVDLSLGLFGIQQSHEWLSGSSITRSTNLVASTARRANGVRKFILTSWQRAILL
jgi:hypothetical protein